MSGKNNSSSNAGLFGAAIAGGALLGAALYAAYETYNLVKILPSQTSQPQELVNKLPSQTSQPQELVNKLPSQTSQPQEQSCVLCTKNLIAEATIGLPCEHCFHKACLKAHHVLHLDEAYKCPTCSVPVPEIILKSLHD